MRIVQKNHSLFIVAGVLVAVFVIAQIFGIRLCAVQSGSMEPNISTYSICLVTTHVNYDEIQTGDIVVYNRTIDNLPIIHRVIAITDEGLITKGDANQNDDGISVTPDNLYARYIINIPYAGYAYNFVHNPFGLALVVAVIILLFGVDIVNDKRKLHAEQ